MPARVRVPERLRERALLGAAREDGAGGMVFLRRVTPRTRRLPIGDLAVRIHALVHGGVCGAGEGEGERGEGRAAGGCAHAGSLSVRWLPRDRRPAVPRVVGSVAICGTLTVHMQP